MSEFLTLEQLIQSDIFIPDYKQKLLTESDELCKTVSQFYPCQVLAGYSIEDGKKIFERTVVRLSNDFISLQIRYDTYKKHYNIYAYEEFNKFKNLSMHSRNNLIKHLVEPQNMGVLTTRKITAWVNYYLLVMDILSDADAENLATIEQFKKSLEGQEVIWSKDMKDGRIVKNGIEFWFNIYDGYIDKKIKLAYGGPTSLDTFIKLSDNKLISQPNF